VKSFDNRQKIASAMDCPGDADHFDALEYRPDSRIHHTERFGCIAYTGCIQPGQSFFCFFEIHANSLLSI
jgi:hypothetical protein